MRFLIVGAGATGGYFGGRLLEAGCDVTFLLRARRAEQIARTGLVIRSPHGDVTLPSPPHVLAEEITAPYDVVLVSCKAYDLDATMDSFAPAVAPGTAILPVLNGMGHMDRLAVRFGAEQVLGGLCFISSTLDDEGHVLHLNDLHTLMFGEPPSGRSARVDAIAAEMSRAGFVAQASETILHDMWEKWVFIASLGGLTTLMRASVGDVAAAGGSTLGTTFYEECSAIARHNGFAPREVANQRARAILSIAGSPLVASMLKDIERGARIEGEHIVGDLLRRGSGEPGESTLLQLAYTGLRSYEARRAREGQG